MNSQDIVDLPMLPNDPLFQVVRLAAGTVPMPNTAVYLAMHQDYHEDPVYIDYFGKSDWFEKNMPIDPSKYPIEYDGDSRITPSSRTPTEAECGQIIKKELLGKTIHGGPFEHPSMQMNFVQFPHSCMQQMRTHRTGITFDVQCLAPESKISVLLRNGWNQITIRQLAKQKVLPAAFSLNEETGAFERNQIEEVLINDIKQIYEVVTSHGEKLRCTMDHRIYSHAGWKRLSELKVGDRIWCEKRHRPWLREIVSIKYIRDDITYDLVMAAPHHSFIANGVVVHNSFRYTGTRILDFLDGTRNFNEVFYFRPAGVYTDRRAGKYNYTFEDREADIKSVMPAIERYGEQVAKGIPKEHMRSVLPFDVRQSWVMSANARTIMHLLDMRWPSDAQHEARQLSQLMFNSFKTWMPETAEWYFEKRARKSMLAF